MKRKGISKALRFRIFARDGFTCRYCGRQSDAVSLQVDHIIPVCQDGTNDEENLITSCADCNSGKAGHTIAQSAPTEEDGLRLAQERNEQLQAARAASEAAKARREIFQRLVNHWCACSGRDTVPTRAARVVFSFIEEFGADAVFRWIEIASTRCDNDMNICKYVCGIRRQTRKENGATP